MNNEFLDINERSMTLNFESIGNWIAQHWFLAALVIFALFVLRSWVQGRKAARKLLKSPRINRHPQLAELARAFGYAGLFGTGVAAARVFRSLAPKVVDIEGAGNAQAIDPLQLYEERVAMNYLMDALDADPELVAQRLTETGRLKVAVVEPDKPATAKQRHDYHDGTTGERLVPQSRVARSSDL